MNAAHSTRSLCALPGQHAPPVQAGSKQRHCSAGCHVHASCCIADGCVACRRAVHADKDIDFINDRNAHFNKKIDRAFGVHTREIKANLERGTALPD